MGMAYVEARLVGPSGEKPVTLLVDTGSLLTWVSRESLLQVGVDPSGRRRFMAIEGRELVRDTGEAVLEIMGAMGTPIVVFGDPGDAEGAGVVSLEGLGLEVDAATKSLRKTGGFAAYMSAAG